MTVATKLQQAIASCESTLSSLHSFALDTQNQEVKQAYQSFAQSQQLILDGLNQRLQAIQAEEPQYKQI